MMKRMLALGTAIVLLAMIPAVSMAQTWNAYVYTSNHGPLNLRSKPVTHANNKITGIPYGSEVTIIDLVDNTWAYVAYNGREGYVMRRYLSYTRPSGGGSGSGSGGSSEPDYSGFERVDYQAQVRASTPGSYVNLRFGPSKSTAVQEKVYDGGILNVIAQNKKWAQVRDPSTGVVGYMMRVFLTRLSDGTPDIGSGVTINDQSPDIGGGATGDDNGPAIGTGASGNDNGPAIGTGASAN